MKLLAFTLLLLVGILVLCVNVMRCGSDAALGTNAHINLSAWNSFLLAIKAEDVNAIDISIDSLPANISAEQLKQIRDVRIPSGGNIPEFPHVLDPWGNPLKFELLSTSPAIHWRVSSRVGRTFWGRWVVAVQEPTARILESSATP